MNNRILTIMIKGKVKKKKRISRRQRSGDCHRELIGLKVKEKLYFQPAQWLSSAIEQS